MVTRQSHHLVATPASHPVLEAMTADTGALAARALSAALDRAVDPSYVDRVKSVMVRVQSCRWFTDLDMEHRHAVLVEAGRLTLLEPRESNWRDFVDQWSKVAELDSTCTEVERYLGYAA